MDERTARKLRAAAEHERRVADLAAEAVTDLEAKMERDVARMQEALDNARAEADAAETLAAVAEQAAIDAGATPGLVDGPSVTAVAQTATAKGKGGV